MKIVLGNLGKSFKPEFLVHLRWRLKKIRGEGKRAVIFELAQFFIILGILGGGLSVLFLNTRALQNSIFEKRKLITAIDQRLASEASLRKDSGRLKGVFPRMAGLLPTESDLPSFLSKVELTGDSLGALVIIEFGSKEATAEASGVSALAVSFKTNVTLSSLGQFFERLGALPYIIQVSSFEVIAPEGVDKTTGQSQIKGSLFIR